MDLSLYLVTDRALSGDRPLEWVVEQALQGGVTLVQLREKHCSTREFVDLAQRVLAITRPAGVPLLINDRVDVALAVDADGVHLGQSDMPYALARRLLGPGKILGLSVETVEQAEAAEALDVDYLGVSPVYTTPTKAELQAPLGLDGLRRIRGVSRHPLVAIGGMNAETAADALRAGADGVAVVSAICAAADPRAAAADLAALIRAHRPPPPPPTAAPPSLRELGEFGWIERMALRLPPPPAETLGIGDDCAALPWTDERLLLVTTDMLVEDRHFLRAGTSPEDLGHKALAVGLSDIAAMGGAPLAAFLSIGVPPSLEVDWLDRFFGGIRELSEATACPLLGGDTTKSDDGIVIDFTVLGSVERRGIKCRSNARPDDVVAVTGTLGDSGVGLRLLLEGQPLTDDDRQRLAKIHCRPAPHLAEGQWLSAREEVHAMMDVSDGIDSDLRHIMKRSGVGAVVDLEALPISEAARRVCADFGWVPEEFAVSGGEDYCLLCTVNPETFPAVADAFEATFGRALSPIGTICGGTDLVVRRGGQDVTMARHGFDHFKSS